GMDAQAGFDQADVLIAGAKEAFDASADTHAGLHGVSAGYLRRITRQESTLRWKRLDRSTTRSRGELKTIWEYYPSAVKATRFRPGISAEHAPRGSGRLLVSGQARTILHVISFL